MPGSSCPSANRPCWRCSSGVRSFRPPPFPGPTWASCATICDKQQVLERGVRLRYRRAASGGAAVPGDAHRAHDLPYPLVVKPARSVGEAGGHRRKLSVRYAASGAGLQRVVSELPAGGVPPARCRSGSSAPGSGSSCCSGTAPCVPPSPTGVSARSRPPGGSASTVRASPPDGDLVQRAVRLLQALRLAGRRHGRVQGRRRDRDTGADGDQRALLGLAPARDRRRRRFSPAAARVRGRSCRRRRRCRTASVRAFGGGGATSISSCCDCGEPPTNCTFPKAAPLASPPCANSCGCASPTGPRPSAGMIRGPSCSSPAGGWRTPSHEAAHDPPDARVRRPGRRGDRHAPALGRTSCPGASHHPGRPGGGGGLARAAFPRWRLRNGDVLALKTARPGVRATDGDAHEANGS